VPAPDPWTYFLDWLTTVIVPNWTELVSMLPFWILLGVVGPILTLIALAWVWHFMTKPRARVETGEPEGFPAPMGADGLPAFPANVPYCLEHSLIYPASRARCAVDGTDLSVRCPVDGTVRDASIQTCSGCGTRFVLGASSVPALVVRHAGPPEGGAAVA
jgi:hypothetical protein